MLRTESEIDSTHLVEAAQQQSGSCQQYQRNRDFRDHERGTQTRMASAGATACGRLLSGCYSRWSGSPRMPVQVRRPVP